MTASLEVRAHLRFRADVPGFGEVTGGLTGSGQHLELRVSNPVAFAGRDDSTAQPHDMAAWRDETAGGFALHCFDGGHFFLQSAQEAVLRQLRAELI